MIHNINNLSLTKKIISYKFSISEVTISKIYKKIAGDVAAKLSVFQAQSAGQFKSMTLEWQ